MKFFLPIFCTILAGCGNLLDPVRDDPRFHPIRDQFVKDAKVFGIDADISNIRIAFGDIKKKIKFAGFVTMNSVPREADAYCLVFQESHNDIIKPIAKIALGKKYKLKVVIISNELKDEPLESLEPIVYHELGHCALNLTHNPNEQIMNPYIAVDKMTELRYFYLRELFTHRPFTQSPSIREMRELTRDLKVVYQVDYAAFNQRIFHQLLFDQTANQYIVNENPELTLE